MKKEYKNYIMLLLGSVIIIMLLTCNKYLFGSSIDWTNQHIQFYDYLRKTIYETKTIFLNFSFHYGAGINIYKIAYYGLYSPIVLLSLFFPFIDMTMFVILTSIISLILSVFLMYKFLRSHFNGSVSLVASFLFLYATPLIFHFHRQLMFVNYMPFLLLALIGIDKYLKTNKIFLLCLGIVLMILSSFYYSVGGLLCIISYAVYQIIKKKKKWSFFFKLCIEIFFSVLITSFFLLPILYVLKGERGSSISLISILKPNLNLKVLLYDSYGMGVSLISFLSIIYLLFAEKKIDKYLAIGLLIILICPLFMYLLNGGLYIRSKVLIPLLPLVIYVTALFIDKLNEDLKIKYPLIITSIIVLINVIYYQNYLLILDLCVLLLSFFFIKQGFKKLSYILILILVFGICLFTNKTETFVSKNVYNSVYNDDITQEIKAIDKQYFRTNNLLATDYTINKIYDDTYYTTSMYASSYNSDYYYLYKQVFKNSLSLRNHLMFESADNVLFNTLMGVKYIVSDKEFNSFYKKVDGYNYIYENRFAFPLGYASDRYVNIADFNKLNYPYNISYLLSSIVSNETTNYTKNFIKEIPLNLTNLFEYTNGRYYLDLKEDMIYTLKQNNLEHKIVFIVIEDIKSDRKDISITINDITNTLTNKWLYYNNNETFTFVLTDVDELYIKMTKGHYDIGQVKVYIMDDDIIKNSYDYIDKMQITHMQDNQLMGNINITRDSYFVLTLPYDKGFKIYVNGVLTPYEKVNTAFIGLKLNKGKYDIKVIYEAPNLKIGGVISIVSLILLMIINKMTK